MVEENKVYYRCRQCKELLGSREAAYVYCPFLHMNVWGDSLMCPHGEFLMECF